MKRLIVTAIGFLCLFQCAKPPAPKRISCMPVFTRGIDETLFYADQINTGLKNQHKNLLVYPLDWYFYSLYSDSLDNTAYLRGFARRMELDELVLLKKTGTASDQPIYQIDRIEISEKGFVKLTEEQIDFTTLQKSVSILPETKILFRRVAEIDSELLKGRYYFLKQDYEKAGACYARSRRLTRIDSLYMAHAVIQQEMIDHPNTPVNTTFLEWENSLKRMQAGTWADAMIYQALARMRIGQKRFNDAGQYLEKSLKADSLNVETLLLTAVLNEKRIRKMGYGSRKALLERAVALNPICVKAYLMLANTAYFKMDDRKTIETYQRLLTIDPFSLDALMALGRFYLVKNDFQNLIPVFEKVLQLYPDYADAYYNLGIAYYNNEKTDLARQFFEKAIALDAHADSYLYLGYIHAQAGEKEKARVCYQKRIQLKRNLSDSFAEEARKQLVKLLSEKGE